MFEYQYLSYVERITSVREPELNTTSSCDINHLYAELIVTWGDRRRERKRERGKEGEREGGRGGEGGREREGGRGREGEGGREREGGR